MATRAIMAANLVSRRLRLGGGSVIGGRLGLVLDPGLLGVLAAGRQTALVSGTNGKTTTTRLLSAALGGPGRVATSSAGANLPAGLVAALAASPDGAPAVLEVDEGYLPRVAGEVHPHVVLLLNLSRDQLDRVGEVRMIARRWRSALASTPAVLVANADDPLVVFAASGGAEVRWVGVGQLWRSDAAGCPVCGGRIEFAEPGSGGQGPDRDAGERPAWGCLSCGFARPRLDARLDGAVLTVPSGQHLSVDLALPGRCNLANAAMAAVGAGVLGVDEADALVAMAAVDEVEGRFATVALGPLKVRLLLAKNPAGWAELLDLLHGGTEPIVVGINAQVADGRDPSWLWDVDFERLRGRLVVAAGERCRDLAVRLRYAGVDHRTVPEQWAALQQTGSSAVEYIGNYTAFQELRRRLAAGAYRPGATAGGAGAPVVIGEPVPVPSPPDTMPADRTDWARGPGWALEHRAEHRPHAHRPYARSGPSVLRVVVVHPDLLGTYGDGGNGRILAARATWRDQPAELVLAHTDDVLPESGDIYCLGGGEDGPQVEAAALLGNGGLRRAVERGAVVLAVCAGFQVAGMSFPDADGSPRQGLGLLDVTTVKGPGRRAVGESAAVPASPLQEMTSGRLGMLTGFENHAGATRLGPTAQPLGRVMAGVGNGDGSGSEGAWAGRVVGTYLHGPVLARNPAFADLLLGMATGSLPPLLPDAEEHALRAERLRSRPAKASDLWLRARRPG